MSTLYRIQDASGGLLYVGITGTNVNRLHGHARTSRWWEHAASATFEHGATLATEAAAIAGELPRFNVEHTERRDWVEVLQDAISTGYLADRSILEREIAFLERRRAELRAALVRVDEDFARCLAVHKAARPRRQAAS